MQEVFFCLTDEKEIKCKKTKIALSFYSCVNIELRFILVVDFQCKCHETLATSPHETINRIIWH